MPPRLQRFFLRLLKYDWVMQYAPGKQLVLADMLSRAPADVPDDASDGNDVEVHAVSTVTTCVSGSTMKRLAEESEKDTYLHAVMERLRHGMPIDGELKPFEYELSVVKGIFMKGSKVVIPASMRSDTLQRIHQGQMVLAKMKCEGTEICILAAHQRRIRHYASSMRCVTRYAYSQPIEPLSMRQTPPFPWHRVGVDLFQYGGKSHQPVYDALSNFPEVEGLLDTSAEAVVSKLKTIFARYGITPRMQR